MPTGSSLLARVRTKVCPNFLLNTCYAIQKNITNIQNINYFPLLFFHGGFPMALCISMYFTTATGVSYVKTLSNASFIKFAILLYYKTTE